MIRVVWHDERMKMKMKGCVGGHGHGGAQSVPPEILDSFRFRLFR